MMTRSKGDRAQDQKVARSILTTDQRRELFIEETKRLDMDPQDFDQDLGTWDLMMDPPFFTTAQHEAAHVVIAHAIGGRVNAIDMRPNSAVDKRSPAHTHLDASVCQYDQLDQPTIIARLILMSLAGPVFSADRGHEITGSRRDLDTAWQRIMMLELITGQPAEEIRMDAVERLRFFFIDLKSQIEELADHLEAGAVLDHDEVSKLLAGIPETPVFWAADQGEFVVTGAVTGTVTSAAADDEEGI